MSEVIRILVFDGDADDGKLIAHLLETSHEAFRAEPVSDPLAFAEHLTRGDFSAVITEYALAWGDGLQVLEAVKARYPACPVLLFTAGKDPEVYSRALRKGLDGFLPKTSNGYLRLGAMVWELLCRVPTDTARETGEDRLIDELPIGIFYGEVGRGLVRINRAAREIFGFSSSDRPGGRDLGEYISGREAREAWDRALAGRNPLHDFVTRIRGADGVYRTVRIHLAFEGDAVMPSGYAGTVEEQTLSAGAEAAAGDGNLDVTAAVCHDLQGPIQIVRRYGRLLDERHGEALDKEGSRFLRHVLESAERMQERVDDMLAFARAGTKTETAGPTDLGLVVEEALAAVRAAIDEAGAEVDVGPLPTVKADSTGMLHVFENLLGNALKFRGDEPPPDPRVGPGG